MASLDDPAFPVIDFARIVSTPGMTAMEHLTSIFVAAHISRFGAINTDQLVIDRCKLLADMTLSHRRAN